MSNLEILNSPARTLVVDDYDPWRRHICAVLKARQVVPSPKVLFLSQNHDAEVVQAALGNGAQGYVLKADAGSELLPAIKAILRGERFVSSSTNKTAKSTCRKAHPQALQRELI